MKRYALFFLVLYSMPCSGASIALSGARILGDGISHLASWCTYKTARAALAASTAVGMIYLHHELMKMVKKELEQYQKWAQEDPVPDCPVKKKIAEKFAHHGYEVSFVRQRSWSTDNAAVLAYGRKVIFLVFEDGKHTFFNDPKLDAARDGIIEHEIAHVLHGDTTRMMRYVSFTVPLALAAAVYAGMEVARCDVGALMTSLSQVSSIPHGIRFLSDKTAAVCQKTYGALARCMPQPVIAVASYINERIPEKLRACGHTLATGAVSTGEGFCRGCVGAISTKATAHVTLAGTILGMATLSRYQEKCADYAAVKLQNPTMLEGMADFFKRLGEGRTPHNQKGWKEWWYDKFVMSHPCCHERCRYLQYEAEKIRKKKKATRLPLLLKPLSFLSVLFGSSHRDRVLHRNA